MKSIVNISFVWNVRAVDPMRLEAERRLSGGVRIGEVWPKDSSCHGMVPARVIRGMMCPDAELAEAAGRRMGVATMRQLDEIREIFKCVKPSTDQIIEGESKAG